MSVSKKTLVLGASENPERYSNMAMRYLLNNGHEVLAIGRKNSSAYGVPITTELQAYENVDTITLYMNPQHQQAYYQYILSLKPQRVIFNPGTENAELEELLNASKIPYMEACTLVLLQTKQY